MWLGKLTALVMTPLGWLGRKTSTQTKALVYITLSIGWFCKQTLKALISLCRCPGWSRHSLSAHALKSHFHNHAVMCEPLYEKLFFQMCSSKVEIQGGDPEWFLRGFDLIILPYLPYVLGQTGLHKQCRPRMQHLIKVYTVCHSPSNFTGIHW